MLEELKTKGFTRIQVSIPEQLCNEVILAYREFDKSTSLEDKESTTYPLFPESKIEFGYENRLKEKGFDNKSYFHYNPDLLKKNFLKGNSKYKLFIEKANILFLQIQNEIKKVLVKLSKETNIELDKLINTDGTPSINMRIVNYKPTLECETLAKPHYDWCIMTFAIYETHTGLNFLHKNKKIPIQYDKNEMKLFPSKGWNKYIKTKIDALEHEVENTGGNTQRSAIVIFVNPKIY